MANITLIQSKINKGYGTVAKILGDQYSWYRPFDPLRPISLLSLQGVISAQFSPEDKFSFSKPADFNTRQKWYGTFEGQANIQTGDYFIGRQGTYYLAYGERLTPLHCVWCNRTITIGRPQVTLTPGASTGYGGSNVALGDVPAVLQNWPACVEGSARMRSTKMGLPSDGALGNYDVYLPSLPSTPIQWNDIITDDLGRRYIITNLDLTELGWKIVGGMVPT